MPKCNKTYEFKKLEKLEQLNTKLEYCIKQNIA